MRPGNDVYSADYGFFTLALRSKYRLLATQLAQDLASHAPGRLIIVGTDAPEAFQSLSNVKAFKLKQTGILHCFHDKRFVLEQALAQFPAAVYLDADTRIFADLPAAIPQSFGLAAVHVENLLAHVGKYNPERVPHVRHLAEKLDLNLDDVKYIGESLIAVSAENHQTSGFIQQWGKIARYLELRGVYSGQGISMGLAAAQVGLEITSPIWLSQIDHSRKHLDASYTQANRSLWDQWQRRLGYHYRLNRTRIAALRDFGFYYR